MGKHLTYFYRQTKLFKNKKPENKGNLHFDYTLLMESIGNNANIFDELLEAIYLQFSQDLKILQKAITEQNLPEIKRIIHSIKGAALNMWFSQMAELAIELELNLDKGDFGELQGLYNHLAMEWEYVQTLLKNM